MIDVPDEELLRWFRDEAAEYFANLRNEYWRLQMRTPKGGGQ